MVLSFNARPPSTPSADRRNADTARALRWMVAAALNLVGMFAASAGEPPIPSVTSGRIERLESLDFGDLPARPVDVWLPDGPPPERGFAVLYMHDGQMLFDATQTWNRQAWRVDEVASRLIAEGDTRPFIVVAVHNGGDARHAEYFPQKAFDRLPVDARTHYLAAERSPGQKMFTTAPYADRYLRFLVERLKPEIDRRYPTRSDPRNTVVMGSSMGGLISLYALSEYPDTFGAAGCLSTHWPGGWDPEATTLPDALFDFFAGAVPAAGRHRLYFDYGNATLDALYPPLQRRVDALLERRGYGASDWTTRFFEGADHSERAWAARLDQPLRFLLPPDPA